MKTAHVISIGIINMTTGVTGHEWSIYPDPNAEYNLPHFAYLSNNGFLLIASEGTFKIGDECELKDNDSQRKLKSGVKIVDSSSCDKETLLAMLKKNNYDYYPIKAFRSRAKGNRKLSTSYSVKGVE
jgi:hypothetical protein